MKRDSPKRERATSVSKARTLEEIGEYWDTHEFITKSENEALRHPVIFHVLPVRREEWKVESEDSPDQAKHYRTKREAWDSARKLARRADCGIVVIHRADGTVQTEHRYGGRPLLPGDEVAFEIDLQRVRHYMPIRPDLMKRALREARERGISAGKLIDQWLEEGARRAG
jgi:hypothetical protein